MKTKLTLLIAAALCGCGQTPQPAQPRSPVEPFRIAIIPDTQWASLKWPDVLMTTTRWIAANRESMDIKYEMLFDWQHDKLPEPNSYFALAEIDPVGKRISIRSYSPMLDKYKTDKRGQFEFRNVKFVSSRR